MPTLEEILRCVYCGFRIQVRLARLTAAARAEEPAPGIRAGGGG